MVTSLKALLKYISQWASLLLLCLLYATSVPAVSAQMSVGPDTDWSCGYGDIALSNDGAHMAYYYADKRSSSKLNILRLSDSSIIFKSAFTSTQFKWAFDSDDYFYFNVYLGGPDGWLTMQRSVDDGSLGYPFSFKSKSKYFPILGPLGDQPKSPLYINGQQEPGLDGKVLAADWMLPGPLLKNLGYIPQVRYNANKTMSLIHKYGPSYESSMIAPDSALDEKLIYAVPDALGYWTDPLGQPIIVATRAQNDSVFTNIRRVHGAVNKASPVAAGLRASLDHFRLPGIDAVQDTFYPVFDEENNLVRLFSMDSFDTNTAALNERSIKDLSLAKTLYQDPSYDVSKAFLGRDNEPLGVQLYRDVATFIPLSGDGARLAKHIALLSPPSFPYDTIVRSIARNAPIAVVELASAGNTQLYLVDFQKGTHKKITQNCERPRLEAKVLSVETANKDRVEAYLLGLPGLKEDAPLMVSLHGGPRSRDSLSKMNPGDSLFIRQGWRVLRINFRGSSGFGKRSLMQLMGHVKTMPVEDTIAVLDYLKSDLGLSLTHSVLTGQSFGGYQVLNFATSQYHRYFDAFVAIHSPIEFSSLDEGSGGNATKYFQRLGENAHCPLPKVMHDKPLVVVWGAHDSIVDPKTHSAVFIKENKNRNIIPLELVNDAHSFSPESIKVINATLLEEIIMPFDQARKNNPL
ncbi:MAG: dienelactone hydrolase [Flavobacteriales bacterium]|jgi:dienelactone hydrolase